MEPDLAALAARLRGAQADGRPIPMLTLEAPELEVADAYRIQGLNVAQRIDEGDTQVGFKLGLTSRAKQEAMGVSAPLWAPLFDSGMHVEEQPLEVGGLIHPRIEPEIGFLIGRDIASHADVPKVLAATDGLFAALEIIDSRYDDFRFTLPDVIADRASAAAHICGGRLLPPGSIDAQIEGMILSHNGVVLDTATGAAVSGHPAAAVAWLARQVGGIPAGSIVLSGGMTAAVPLQPGSVVTARFASLGQVGVRCC